MNTDNVNYENMLTIVGQMISQQKEESKRDEERRKKDLEVTTGMFNSMLNIQKENKILRNDLNDGLKRLENLEKTKTCNEGQLEILKIASEKKAKDLAYKYFKYLFSYDNGNRLYSEKIGQINRFIKRKLNYYLERSGGSKFNTILQKDFEKAEDYLKVVDLSKEEVVRIEHYKSKIKFNQSIKMVN